MLGKQQNLKHLNLLYESEKIMNEKKFITIREAVEQYKGLSEYYFRNLIENGKLPYLKSGNRILIEVAELETFLFITQHKEVR